MREMEKILKRYEKIKEKKFVQKSIEKNYIKKLKVEIFLFIL